MKRRVSIAALSLVVLAGCSSGTNDSATTGTKVSPGSAATTANATAPAAADTACSGGLTGNEPGVVSVNCGGTAEIKIQAGGANADIHGGTCRSASDIWSAAAGVLIDVTGLHGAYTGPKVDSVVVNNTATQGKATIQATVGGKNYFNLGDATMTQSSDGKTAHIEGKSDPQSDAPGATIIVDVTC